MNVSRLTFRFDDSNYLNKPLWLYAMVIQSKMRKKIPLNSLCMSFTFSRPSPLEILDEFDLNSKMFLSTHHLRQAIFHL